MATLFSGIRMAARSVAARSNAAARRNLHLHEAYSMELMRKAGVNVPKGELARSPEAAERIIEKFGGVGVVKAQVLAGGRGKGYFENGFQGGVHIANSPSEGREIAEEMIGHKLITKQTGAAGRPCNMVFITQKSDIIKEVYFAILFDRESQGPIVVASHKGGMDIETVAKEDPDAIVKQKIDITKGLTEEQASDLADKMGFSPQTKQQAIEQMLKLYGFFCDRDATMVEINPLVQDSFGNVLCLDAKVNFDDNALYRQTDVAAQRDYTQENPLDVKAIKNNLNYIGLDGSIGCLVNGAGLAMSTMDIIQLYGGKPANFLDIGGGATADQVKEAFHIITTDQKVNCIMVNIFGGIMRCDVIAEGIIHAVHKLDLKVPLVVRLQGTRRLEAKAMIASSGLDILTADELDQAARKAVQVARIVELAKEAHLTVKFKDEFKPTKASPKLTPSFT